MNEQTKPNEAANQAGPDGQKPTHRAVSDPREVARVVVTRMAQVNAKKDELTLAINGLIDITQQLTRTCVQLLEAGTPAGTSPPAATVQ
jgi:hypothetical protein